MLFFRGRENSSSSSSTGKRDAVLSPRHGAFSEQLCLHRAAGEHNSRDCEHPLLIRAEAHAGTAAAGWDRVPRKSCRRQVFCVQRLLLKRCAHQRSNPYAIPTHCMLEKCSDRTALVGIYLTALLRSRRRPRRYRSPRRRYFILHTRRGRALSGACGGGPLCGFSVATAVPPLSVTAFILR